MIHISATSTSRDVAYLLKFTMSWIYLILCSSLAVLLGFLWCQLCAFRDMDQELAPSRYQRSFALFQQYTTALKRGQLPRLETFCIALVERLWLVAICKSFGSRFLLQAAVWALQALVSQPNGSQCELVGLVSFKQQIFANTFMFFEMHLGTTVWTGQLADLQNRSK